MRVIPEDLIFDLCRDDKPGLVVNGAEHAPPRVELGFPVREDIGGMSQATEIDVIRHYTRLSTTNFDIDRGLYPLGSCTMKHNPRVNEAIAAEPHWKNAHPYWPAEFLQGHEKIMEELRADLAEISGFDQVSLLPAAGAHGELTAVFMIRAFHLANGNPDKRTFLIPDSAHGTNPASAAMAGFRCREVKSGPDGYLRLADLEPYLDDDVAAIMITNPNTLGIYEQEFDQIAAAVHDHGGLVYMDGANLNAFMGVFKPGRIGADVMHFNLHKTFTTPHGGGGPGAGPIGFNDILSPFAPESPSGIGPVKAYMGQWGMFIRAWAYIRSLGGSGLREASEEAVLNANYLRSSLEDALAMPFKTSTLHEVVFSDAELPNEVTTGDVAKRLIDYGFHPPTVYFPIHVDGALMIEPTETESIEELNRFIVALRAVVREAAENPDRLKTAPHTTPVSRVDEVRAARSLDLRWRPDPEAT